MPYIGTQPNDVKKNTGLYTPSEILQLTKEGSWGGSLELIEEQTVSGTPSSIDFINLANNPYDVYFMTVNSFSSATDYGALSLRVSTDNGSSFKTTGYQYANQYNNAGSNGEQRSTSYSSITNMTPPNSGASPFASNCYAYLYNFLDSTKYSFATFQSTAYISAVPEYEGYFGGGVYPVAETHNAIRLFPQNSSNVDQGTFKLYGVKQI
jgi:hypothetical protein